MEKYFLNNLLPRIDNIENLFIAVYFYETNILTLLKFREKIVKRPANRELHDLNCDLESESSESEEKSITEEITSKNEPPVKVQNNIAATEPSVKPTNVKTSINNIEQPKDNLLR